MWGKINIGKQYIKIILSITKIKNFGIRFKSVPLNPETY